jgi:hypothetical protein
MNRWLLHIFLRLTEVLSVTAMGENGQIALRKPGQFHHPRRSGTSVIYYNNQPYYVVGTSGATACNLVPLPGS